MTKWAEVTIQGWKTFAVEIEDDETIEDAERYALDEMFALDNVEVMESNFVKEAEVESLLRHADKVLEV